jgi:hypothetical protein
MELLNLHVSCKHGLIPRCCFSRHIVQTYIFVPKGELRQHVEVSLDCLWVEEYG